MKGDRGASIKSKKNWTIYILVNVTSSINVGVLGKVLDVRILEELRSLDGGEGEILKGIVAIFEESAAQSLREIHEAFSEGNVDWLRRAAHSLKGSSSNLGAIRLRDLALSMETMGRDGDLGGVPGILASTERELVLALRELNERV